jgi:hypothetical protein
VPHELSARFVLGKKPRLRTLAALEKAIYVYTANNVFSSLREQDAIRGDSRGRAQVLIPLQ